MFQVKYDIPARRAGRLQSTDNYAVGQQEGSSCSAVTVTHSMERDTETEGERERIIKEGWLLKRGEVIKNWRPRYVVSCAFPS